MGVKSNYAKFNLICLVLSGVFIVGTIFVYVRNTKTAEVRNDVVEIKEIKKLGNLETDVIERDSSATTSLRSVSARNDSIVLPKEFLLDVPFTSQAPEKNWEEPWQDACEEAAVLMLDAYYKKYNLSPLFARDEILKIVKWEEEQNWEVSIPAEKVKQLLEYRIGKVKARIIENPTVEQIKKFIAAGNPVLATADGKVLPNPNFRNGGPVYHALIIKGYTETEFITNDPGTQFGADFKYKYDDLLNAIHDWNEGKVKEGKRVVLVID